MVNCSVNVIQRSNGALGGRPPPCSDGAGACWSLTPTALHPVRRRVKLTPLAASKECPFQGVLENVLVLATFATRVLGAVALDVGATHDLALPRPIVGTLANEIVQALPVVRRQRLVPRSEEHTSEL